jgi:hypothetical protein
LYITRNTCNSVFWTIWLKWCFLHSERLYLYFEFNLNFFFITISFCSISSLFLERFTFLFYVRQELDSISSNKNVDFEIFLNDVFKSHLEVEHYTKNNYLQHVVEIVIVNVFNDVKLFNSIILLNNWHNILNMFREFNFVFRFVRRFASDKQYCIVIALINDNEKNFKIWK